MWKSSSAIIYGSERDYEYTNKAYIYTAAYLTLFLITGCQAEKQETPQVTQPTVNNQERIIWAEGDLNGKVNIQMENSIQNSPELFFNKPERKPSGTSIKILKSSRTLELYADNQLIGRFKIGLGSEPQGTKYKEGDCKTPEGDYYICTRNNMSRFKLFLGLSYPNTEDARNGLESDLINHSEFQAIKEAQRDMRQPPWNTPLGGEVGIHGGGNSSD